MNELYKIILVDDEDEVRGRISSKISKEMGFEIVGNAGNGFDALELIEKHKPDVVLTDIKMPFVDGIELATTIKSDFPSIKVAFITGHDEFEYAREAINLNVVGYLTKPITQGRINKFLTQLKIELDKEYKEKYDIDNLKLNYEKNIPIVVENYFRSLLVGNEILPKDIDLLNTHSVNLSEGSFLVTYIECEMLYKTGNSLQHNQLKMSIINLVQKILDTRYEYYQFLYETGIVLVVKTKGPRFLRDIDHYFFELIQSSKKYLDTSIVLGVSRMYEGYNKLSIAYQESRKAIEFSGFMNVGKIIYINEVEFANYIQISLSENEVKNLEYCIKYKSKIEIEEMIDSYHHKALSFNDKIIDFDQYSITLTSILINYANSYNVNMKKINDDDILTIVNNLKNVDSLFEFFKKNVFKIKKISLDLNQKKSDILLNHAIKYIENNYQNPEISLDGVCDYLDVSVSYLSMLIKTNKNTSFTKLLIKLRMDKAKSLLKTSDKKIIEISKECGYKEVYYFSHSFKRVVLMTPKEYRKNAKAV